MKFGKKEVRVQFQKMEVKFDQTGGMWDCSCCIIPLSPHINMKCFWATMSDENSDTAGASLLVSPAKNTDRDGLVWEDVGSNA